MAETNPLTEKPYSASYLSTREAISKLPVNQPEVKKTLFDLLAKHDLVLLQGETGSGKSLMVPSLVLEYFNFDGKVVCSQPRTVNASTIAESVSKVVLDVELGKEVGYKYKYNNKSSDATKLLYTTDGTLLSMCFKDPDFTPWNAVIIDEAHERNVNIDIVLFFIREYLRKGNPKTKFVIMSATMQAEQFREYYKGVSLGEIFVQGRTFPVESRFVDKPLAGNYSGPVLDRIISIVNDEIVPQRKKTGEQMDILAFLPAKRDIDNMCMQIAKQSAKFKVKVVCTPLYSGLDKDKEELATSEDKYKKLAEKPEVKIVLSTNLAETGVTVKGVTYVVDSGYEYESTFDPVTRESTLVNKLIPQAAAKQRMGRAGRTKPGICYHMYTKKEFDTMEKYKRAEISSSNIDGVLLKMLHYGATSGTVNENKIVDILSQLIEPPAKKRVDATFKYLKELSVLSKDGAITPTGMCVYRLNVDIPVALFLVACRREKVDTQRALTLAAIMLVDKNYSGWFRAPSRLAPDYRDQMKKYDTLTSKYANIYGDVFALYDLYNDYRDDKLTRWRKWLNTKHLEEVRKNIRQTERYYTSMEEKCPEELPQKPPGGVVCMKTAEQTLTACLAYGYGNQRAKRRSGNKFEVHGDVIELEPEKGNGVPKFTDEILYFGLSNILGDKKLSGIVNLY